MIRAHAIGVGKPDVLFRTGVYRWMPPLPAIPGAERVATASAATVTRAADVVIVGAGLAGLTAAREVVKTLVLISDHPDR